MFIFFCPDIFLVFDTIYNDLMKIQTSEHEDEQLINVLVKTEVPDQLLNDKDEEHDQFLISIIAHLKNVDKRGGTTICL